MLCNAVCCDLCNKWINIACNNLQKSLTNFDRVPAPNGSGYIAQKKRFPLLARQIKNQRKYIAQKHISPNKASAIESFKAKINNQISDEVMEMS